MKDMVSTTRLKYDNYLSILETRKQCKVKHFFLLGFTPYMVEEPLYKAWSYKESKEIKIKHTGKLFKKNLKIKCVC